MDDKAIFMSAEYEDLNQFVPIGDVIRLGEAYPIDDYTIRFVYGEDSVTPTHFIITKFDMPKPVAETEE